MTKPETEWVLVPREPTREMWAASANALVKDRSWLNIAPDFVTEACYTAMLSASPPAPSVPDVVREARKALRCLFIAVEASVAHDVENKVLAAFAAQAAEVGRLTGEVENLGQALAYQESLIPAEEVAHLRDRAITAESSLETARGALEKLEKAVCTMLAQKTDTMRNGNGIEMDDGEKGYIVHSDDIYALEMAVAKESDE